MIDWLNLGLGSVGGALVSEVLKLLIIEAKRIKDFKPLSKDLASTMEALMPVVQEIDSIQDKLDFSTKELKKLRDTIKQAQNVVHECRGGVSLLRKRNLTKEIKGINQDMLNFCQIDLQFLLFRNQSKLTVSVDGISKNMEHLTGSANGISDKVDHLTDSFDGISKRIDHLSVSAPPVIVDLCSVPKLNMVPVGLDLPLMNLIKMKLLKSEPCLVVSAPPGCGKTTLVTQLCHDEDIKNEFKNIFFSVVSRTPNFKGIIQNLLQHNGCPAHTFEYDSQAAVALRKLLEKLNENSNKTLLVLDDVWHGAERLFLKFFPMNLPGFKILVTSRFDLPSLGPTYKLEPLKDEDAKTLLIQWASRPDGASPDEYEKLLRNILKRCKGFPLVIEVVGVSLKGRSLNSWNSKVEDWFKGEPILDTCTVEECLQPSFDALNLNLKECFLDMGAFIEDQKIRASVIVDVWMELYGQSSIASMNYLEELASHNLLKIVPLGSNKLQDGFYNEFLVTQHDLLRELAICQYESKPILEKKRCNMEIKEDTFPEWCLNPRNPTINASLLSISTNDSFSSSWVELDCPNVEALVLNLSSSDYALPNFIARMKKLKVLTVNNHRFCPARLSNFWCMSSLPNLKRIRLEKVIITSLDILQLQLTRLKKLSLVMCSFGEVFYDTGDVLISKALSSLEEIDIDYCYDLEELPYWISEVDSLKTLSITNCNKLTKLPKAIGNLSKLEILRLYSCINLSELPETIERLINLQFLDISHCLGLSKLPQEIGKLQNLKKISMRKCWQCELPDSMIYLENLVVKCDEETGFLWERLKLKMRNLKVYEEETEHNLNLLHMS